MFNVGWEPRAAICFSVRRSGAFRRLSGAAALCLKPAVGGSNRRAEPPAPSRFFPPKLCNVEKC